MRTAENKVVSVRRTRVGKGIFSRRHYEPFSVVGEITGVVIDDLGYSSEYCFELGNGRVLEPNPPFRFVNHSCEPNCQFDVYSSASGSSSAPPRVLLIATEPIKPGIELTIDYNWAAGAAIRCRCQTPSCRGWVVRIDELSAVETKRIEG